MTATSYDIIITECRSRLKQNSDRCTRMSWFQIMIGITACNNENVSFETNVESCYPKNIYL